MIVVDASAILELLLHSRRARAVIDRLFRRAAGLHAPHLIDVEIAQVLRRYVLNGEMAPGRARAALDSYRLFSLERYSHELLLGRIWDLRANLTAYDAAYVALAELLGAPLVTCDGRLARSTGHRATVELIR